MKCPLAPSNVSLTPSVSGQWERYIGKSKNGKPKRWRFGVDEATAKVRAWQTWQQWDNRPDGVEDWETLEAKESYQQLSKDHAVGWAKYAESQAKKADTPTKTAPVATGITIVDATALYLSSLEKRVGLIGSLGILRRTYTEIAHKLRRALAHLPPTITHLSQLDYDAIEAFIYTLAARPNKRPNPRASKEVKERQATEKVSQRTVLGWIAEVAAWLRWCEDEEGLGFIVPRKTRRLWAIKPTADEQSIRKVTLEEIARLWAGAISPNAYGEETGEIRRLFIALGLNCGFYSIDIATLTNENIVEGHIWKLRRKTRRSNQKATRTKWLLWPETKDLLDKFMPMTVTPNSIRLAWRRLCTATGVNVGHSNLRDTGSLFMERVAGREMADTYLAHARGGVIDSYSHPDWEKLSNALRKFHAELFSPALARAKELAEAQAASLASPSVTSSKN